MQFLSQIPAAIMYNIGFTALLYIMYETFKFYTNSKANTLYFLATALQLLSGIQFTVSIILLSDNTNLIPTNLLTSKSVAMVSYFPYIGILYCALVIGFTLKMMYQFHLLNQYQITADFSKSADWNKIVAYKLNTQLNVKIGYSSMIDAPITFGWLDPIILLPISICNQLSMEQVKVLLLHEMAHIVRYDYIVNILVELIHVILHFNPFSYLLVKEINVQREMSCDAWVVAHTQDPIFYAKALYNLALNTIPKTFHTLSLGAVSHNNELMDRIKYINKINFRSTKFFTLSVVLSSMMIGLVFMSSYFLFSSQSTKMQVMATSIQSLPQAAHPIVSIAHPQIVRKQIHKPIAKLNTTTDLLVENGITENNNKLGLIPAATKDEQIIAHAQTHSPIYSKLVDNTLLWIKSHESINHQTAYNENNESEAYSIAEKLVMRTILKNYQLKRTLLNQKLAEIANEQEANELLINSTEWQQMLQYEQWTKEFLQKHPGSFEALDSLRSF